jgi:hypothetical protein
LSRNSDVSSAFSIALNSRSWAASASNSAENLLGGLNGCTEAQTANTLRRLQCRSQGAQLVRLAVRYRTGQIL